MPTDRRLPSADCRSHRMVVREFVKMAKKKTTEETSTSSAPARRRASAKKQAAPASVPATAYATSPQTEPAQTRTAPSARNGKPAPTQAEIAEAAYYRHLKRGGSQGDEFIDWIEAERELRERD